MPRRPTTRQESEIVRAIANDSRLALAETQYHANVLKGEISSFIKLHWSDHWNSVNDWVIPPPLPTQPGEKKLPPCKLRDKFLYHIMQQVVHRFGIRLIHREVAQSQDVNVVQSPILPPTQPPPVVRPKFPPAEPQPSRSWLPGLNPLNWFFRSRTQNPDPAQQLARPRRSNDHRDLQADATASAPVKKTRSIAVQTPVIYSNDDRTSTVGGTSVVPDSMPNSVAPESPIIIQIPTSSLSTPTESLGPFPSSPPFLFPRPRVVDLTSTPITSPGGYGYSPSFRSTSNEQSSPRLPEMPFKRPGPPASEISNASQATKRRKPSFVETDSDLNYDDRSYSYEEPESSTSGIVPVITSQDLEIDMHGYSDQTSQPTADEDSPCSSLQSQRSGRRSNDHRNSSASQSTSSSSVQGPRSGLGSDRRSNDHRSPFASPTSISSSVHGRRFGLKSIRRSNDHRSLASTSSSSLQGSWSGLESDRRSNDHRSSSSVRVTPLLERLQALRGPVNHCELPVVAPFEKQLDRASKVRPDVTEQLLARMPELDAQIRHRMLRLAMLYFDFPDQTLLVDFEFFSLSHEREHIPLQISVRRLTGDTIIGDNIDHQMTADDMYEEIRPYMNARSARESAKDCRRAAFYACFEKAYGDSSTHGYTLSEIREDLLRAGYTDDYTILSWACTNDIAMLNKIMAGDDELVFHSRPAKNLIDIHALCKHLLKLPNYQLSTVHQALCDVPPNFQYHSAIFDTWALAGIVSALVAPLTPRSS
ncbi:MAG: hypothetical protein Q9227_009059 [Pyrenula ochraceoflavens]